jgi:hypothetical protein
MDQPRILRAVPVLSPGWLTGLTLTVMVLLAGTMVKVVDLSIDSSAVSAHTASDQEVARQGTCDGLKVREQELLDTLALLKQTPRKTQLERFHSEVTVPDNRRRQRLQHCSEFPPPEFLKSYRARNP